MENIKLIVGLGNPSRKYKKTRHNIGFRILEEFREQNKFPKFKIEKKFQAEISEGVINNTKVLLVKPQTFMNNSGLAVKLILNFYKIQPTQLTVVHDELDLPIGETKLSTDRGSAGHNGVKSIMQEIGTQNFTRLRIGIKPKKEGDVQGDTAIKNMVLSKFSKNEEKIINQIVKDACQKLSD
ncbi:MAG: aminoacyl-tRNA hydrolase [Parcubacteria group bacterium]|nr:aminoacyl-tRNA hydrolase [Parcubacteria group bacterium]